MKGQFPCPQCGKPILVRFLNAGDLAKCLSCGGTAVVPDVLHEVQVQPDAVDTDPRTRLLAPMFKRLLKLCKDKPGIRVSEDYRTLSYEAQADTEFNVNLVMDDEDPCISVGTRSGDYQAVVDSGCSCYRDSIVAAQDFARALSGEWRVAIAIETEGRLHYKVFALEQGGWYALHDGKSEPDFTRSKSVEMKELVNHVLPRGTAEAM